MQVPGRKEIPSSGTITQFRNSIQQSCDVVITSPAECQAIESARLSMSKQAVTAKKAKQVEEDLELMEMELDNLSVEGPIQKAKTVRNVATQFIHNNDF